MKHVVYINPVGFMCTCGTSRLVRPLDTLKEQASFHAEHSHALMGATIVDQSTETATSVPRRTVGF